MNHLGDEHQPADRVHAPWAARSATAAAGTQRGGGDGKPASYSGVNGASRLLFSYTVVEGHEDTNGISINANELTHNGATIVDAADSTKNAVLTHGVEPADPDHKVDGVRPVFQSATIFPADPDRIERWTFLHLHFDGEFEDSSTGGVALNVRSEKVFSESTSIPVAPGRYDFNEAEYSFTYNRSAPISFGMRATVAGFFGGDIVTLRPSIRARYGETLSLSLSYSRNDIDLPKGSVTTNLTSPTLRLQLLAAALRPDAAAAQRQRRPLVRQFPRRLAAGCQHRPVSRLQRNGKGSGDVVPSGAGRSVILKWPCRGPSRHRRSPARYLASSVRQSISIR